MKVALGFFIVGISFILSLILSNKYLDRKRFYEDLVFFNNKLKAEIAFSKNTILDLLEKGYAGNGDLYTLLNNKSSANCKRLKYLNEEENLFVLEYLDIIGETDSLSQTKFIEANEDFISNKIKVVVDDCKKYRTLYAKMCILIGLIIYIVVL